jgi:hypothetical protein
MNNVLASPINNVVYVDGVNGAGIGVATSAWSSATAYPLCKQVSYSGGNYLGVAASTNVTPGTNTAVWYPVPNAATPTQLDCAFYIAASLVGSGAGSALRLGPSTYLSNIGLVEPTATVPGWPIVNIYGQGRAVTTIKLNTNNGDGFPFLYLPKTSVNYAFASFNWEGFTVDANYNSTGAVGIYGAQQYTLKDMIIADAADGSDHEIEFGDSTDTPHGWTFEPDIENVDLGTFRGFGTGAIIASTVSGGVPSFTVTAGGSNYNSADTKAVLAGTSDFGRPCTSMGTTTATIVSGAITAITSTATGCVAPLYTIVYAGPNINYGYKFSNTSDSKFISSLTNGGVGWLAGMYLSNITSQMEIYKYHPESVMTGVQNYGGAALYSLQCDTVFQYCLDVEGAGTTDVVSPVFEWNNVNMTASRDYYFGSIVGTPGFSEPQAVNIYGERCGNAAQQPGYAHFDSSAGVIDAPVGSDTAYGSIPIYVHDIHPVYCNLLGQSASVTTSQPTLVGENIGMSNGAVGNQWNFNLGVGGLTGGVQTMSVTQANSTSAGFIGAYTWNWANTTPATSSNNYASPQIEQSGNYWNGSVSTLFGVTAQLNFAAGSNPLATYSFAPVGTTPTAGWQLQLPAATVATTQSAGDSSTKVATDNFVATSFAPLASPALTGSPTAPTQAAGDNSTRIATTAYVANPGAIAPTTVTASGAISGASVTSTPPLGDAGYFYLPGNTANQTVQANTAGDMGPNTATFTGYALQRPSAGPSVASVLCLAAVAGSVSAESFCGITGSGGIVVEANNPTLPGTGAASTPGLSITGAPYTGGSATTNFPQLYLNQGAAVTTLSTAGTEFGINAPSGFTGHLINLFVNGGSTRFRVDYLGNTFVAGTSTLASNLGLSSTTAPTMVAGSAAGTSPTCTSVTGNNNSGVISCSTGTATTASATLATITFNGTLGTVPNGCTLFPRNAATALLATDIYTTAPTSTTFTIAVGGTAATASTAYVWSFLCL